ncbi:SGNH/GDSL hydrolase family protein [Aeromicrobium ginsengisoli]|uniref:SGNH/GDSL hydrolase family protein n=1 Tax=Aeromicrobium ginsengisoli TaxID=363867 RepID=A0A5M4FIB3_9ACTN|nr:SGNH/GDSL hydrolase family protein [Aeromicrobium ginsengisoli]KAA1399924.1 SGNH/GDSL hydrolase family protein [Aeromicrobium ginsengisoli]
MFRRLGLAAAVLAVIPSVIWQPGASAAAAPYVALGDSYSSGVGTRTYISDGTSCQRSVYAYPSLIASAKGYALNFRACSGAKVSDVTSGQLSALSTSTKYVTISVGGNDAGFTDVLTECALPAWASNCSGKVTTAQNYIKNTLPGSLSTLYASIKAKAPNAKVVTVGYPRLFNGEDCNALTWFSPDDESRLNATADLINSKISAAATAKGFTFVSPVSAFIGHAVCDSPEWLNGLSNPVTDSYHPNKLGHSGGYTPLVSAKLIGAAVAVNAAVMTRAESASGKLAKQQRAYAATDTTIRPEVFEVPDLSSPEIRAAAKRAGVDLTSRASIDRVDREYAKAQATR